MDTEENGSKERGNLGEDLLGHAGPTRGTARRGISQARLCSQHRAGLCTQSSEGAEAQKSPP